LAESVDAGWRWQRPRSSAHRAGPDAKAKKKNPPAGRGTRTASRAREAYKEYGKMTGNAAGWRWQRPRPAGVFARSEATTYLTLGCPELRCREAIAITAHAARPPHCLLFDPSVMKNLSRFGSIYSRLCAPLCSSQEVTRLVAHAGSRTSQRQISGLRNQPPLAAMSAI
jgi:hypothetical protein